MVPLKETLLGRVGNACSTVISGDVYVTWGSVLGDAAVNWVVSAHIAQNDRGSEQFGDFGEEFVDVEGFGEEGVGSNGFDGVLGVGVR